MLIRYRLKDAEKTEKDTECAAKPSVDTDRRHSRTGRPPLSPGPTLSVTTSPTEYVRDISWEAYTDLRSLVSVQQVRPFAFRLPWPCGARAPRYNLLDRLETKDWNRQRVAWRM